MDGWTESQTDKQVHRQTDRPEDRPISTQTTRYDCRHQYRQQGNHENEQSADWGGPLTENESLTMFVCVIFKNQAEVLYQDWKHEMTAECFSIVNLRSHFSFKEKRLVSWATGMTTKKKNFFYQTGPF